MIPGFEHFMVQLREMDRIFDPTREYNGINHFPFGPVRRIMCHRNAMTRRDAARTDPMTPTEYLESRFREYFPTATEFDVSFNADETITVDVLFTHPNRVTWECEIGSDDDRYIFTTGLYPFREDRTITIPLMPEA